MISGVSTFNGLRLLLAREARRFYVSTLAELTGIPPSAISQYEKNQRKPSQDILDKLAKALNLPTSYFLHPATDDIGKLYYRSIAATAKPARRRAHARCVWLSDIIDYISQYVDFPKLDMPVLDIPGDYRDLDNDFIEQITIKLRNHWQLGLSPIDNTIILLENHGVIISRQNLLHKGLDALSLINQDNNIIVLSAGDNTNYFRSRFDVAHELGHIILHKDMDSTMINKQADHKAIEEQANHFAAAFLLPEDSYCKDLWVPSLSAFRTLKPLWNVSIAMQVMRCKQLGWIDDKQAQKLWIALSRKKWKTKEPLDESSKVEQPSLLSNAIKLIVDERVKTKSQIIQELSLAPSDIATICNLDEGYLSAENTKQKLSLKENGKVLAFKPKPR